MRWRTYTTLLTYERDPHREKQLCWCEIRSILLCKAFFPLPCDYISKDCRLCFSLEAFLMVDIRKSFSPYDVSMESFLIGMMSTSSRTLETLGNFSERKTLTLSSKKFKESIFLFFKSNIHHKLEHHSRTLRTSICKIPLQARLDHFSA